MTDQELRKLNRLELLELLTKQQERIEELENRVDELEERLQDRQIRIAEAGSIAEAALELTGIFEKAQEAADLYLANVRKGSVKQSTPVPSKKSVSRTVGDNRAGSIRNAASYDRTGSMRNAVSDGRAGAMRGASPDVRADTGKNVSHSGQRPAYSQDFASPQAAEDDDAWLDWID